MRKTTKMKYLCMKIKKDMKFKISLFFFLTFFCNAIFAQDTIKVMQYNLMQYCDYYGTCTAANNGLDAKAANLKNIVNYSKPDIITVEEMGSNMTYVNHLLNNALNVDGVAYWKNGDLTNASGGSIANMIFYDSRKFTLKQSSFVQTAVRDFNIYRLYYNTPDLVNGDTSFIIPIIGHLKAGTADSTARNTQVAALMSRLNNLNVADNYILCGDFNIYTSNEPCYKQLLTYSNPLVRFYDPINKPGNWNNNYNFANIHTQSTHTSGDCFSTGGMDDRFDFILTSSNVLNGYDNVKAITSSYRAVGQDGNRFNGSMISPSNSTIPSSISTSLYNLSDHLPVMMDFEIFYPSCITGVKEVVKSDIDFTVVNPINENLVFNYRLKTIEPLTFSIININGQTMMRKTIYPSSLEDNYSEGVLNLVPGIYLLHLNSKQGVAVSKFIKR